MKTTTAGLLLIPDKHQTSSMTWMGRDSQLFTYVRVDLMSNGHASGTDLLDPAKRSSKTLLRGTN